MYEIEKENLEEKMSLILGVENEKEYLIRAEQLYISYLAKSKELAGPIKKLALANKIKQPLLLDIFMISIASQFFVGFVKEEEYDEFLHRKSTPPHFWNKDLDSKFNLTKYTHNFSSLNQDEINLGFALWNYKKFPYSSITNKKLSNKVDAHAKLILPEIKSLHENLMESIGARKTDIGDSIKPFAYTEKGNVYLKINKRVKGVFIGDKNTRQAKFLISLTEPEFGVHKNTEALFSSIRLPKDAKNERLNNTSLRRAEMLAKIKWTKKELRKKLTGKISFHSGENDNVHWIELVN